MRILLSAYACAPGRGSEAEVGLRAALAAARDHDLWVITREANVSPLRRFLTDHPLSDRISLHGLDLGGTVLRVKERTDYLGMHWYYDRWQRQAAVVAEELDRRVGFDLVHHVTFSSFWTRVGVADLGKPLVWGPVGGGLLPPMGLITEMGLRGVLKDMGRVTARGVLGRWGPSRRARRARVILTQNRATAKRLGAGAQVLPNGLVVAVEDVDIPIRRRREVAVVGRIISLKACPLAVRTFRLLDDGEAQLSFYGTGPDKERVRQLAERWGLGDRVRFWGWLPRDELLERLAGAGVLLHTSLHEEGGLAVAEALSLQTPVVALRHGGPMELVKYWPEVPARLVEPTTPERTARELARATEELLDRASPMGGKAPVQGFADLLGEAYQVAVAGP